MLAPFSDSQSLIILHSGFLQVWNRLSFDEHQYVASFGSTTSRILLYIYHTVTYSCLIAPRAAAPEGIDCTARAHHRLQQSSQGARDDSAPETAHNQSFLGNNFCVSISGQTGSWLQPALQMELLRESHKGLKKAYQKCKNSLIS